jgi:hypothetical protein
MADATGNMRRTSSNMAIPTRMMHQMLPMKMPNMSGRWKGFNVGEK